MNPLRGALLGAALLLAASACGPLQTSTLPNPAPTRLEKQARLHRVLQNARQNLAAGRYQAALAGLRRERERGVSERALSAEYLQALNGVLSMAGQYLEREGPDQAGPLYQAALQAFPRSEALVAGAALTREQVEAHLKECADRLMESGLKAYRSGDLENAIRIWKQIEAFCPGHKASRKALQTAEVQLANLHKIKDGD
jgi:tetratricopeptide (TPR) repeat protein